jgi:uncharacterized cupredoxin-like copper-binding protein
MNADKHKWLSTLTVLLTLGGGPAMAHTGSHDDKKAAYDYSKAEETAFGKASDPRKAKRVVNIEMGDTMRFTPAEITVKRGDSVRFVAKNTGKLMHEMVLGTKKELAEHAEMMKKNPEMEHDEPYMLHVAPGKTGEMGWQFTKAGEFFYGCLVPGHFESGMVGRIKVADAEQPAQSPPAKASPAPSPAAPPGASVEGEVRKIDKEAGKITLKHGPIPNLEMAAMTMVFRVKDPAMLDAVKVGDKVRFKADRVQGAITITEIAASR